MNRAMSVALGTVFMSAGRNGGVSVADAERFVMAVIFGLTVLTLGVLYWIIRSDT